MFCNKCGSEILDGSAFCPNCGQKCEVSSAVKMIQLQCKSCNGIMNVDVEAQEAICPYCGAREKILDSDAVAVERIKSNTHKEVEFAKMANENEREVRKERKEEQVSYRKSKLCKATIIFLFISLILMIQAFKTHHIMAAIIALIQMGIFALSWLMGMQIIKEKKKFIYMALAILGFLLIIPFGICSSGEKLEKLEWPESGIATNLPDPKAKYGDIIVNSDEMFCATIEKYSDQDYEKYVKACQEMGYIVESDTSTSLYIAYNEGGYKLSLSFYSETMDIDLEAPMTMGEFKWPDSEIGELLPHPKSSIGKIEREAEDGFAIYVGNMSIDDFWEYVDIVKGAGFEVDYQKGDTYYQADNAEGYHVNLDYEGNNIIFIRIDEPDEEMESSEDVVSSEVTSTEETGETNNIADDNTKADAELVDPELKAFLDGYEAFIDEYIEFMEKYSESDDTIGMLADYTDMMEKYADFAEKLDEYDSDTMSPADAAYYVEVTARCSEKLMKASL